MRKPEYLLRKGYILRCQIGMLLAAIILLLLAGCVPQSSSLGGTAVTVVPSTTDSQRSPGSAVTPSTSRMSEPTVMLMPATAESLPATAATNSPAALTASEQPELTAGADVQTSLLQRPLNLPMLESGNDCPVTRTPGKQLSPDFGLAVGTGPIYATGTIGIEGKLYYRDSVVVNGWRPMKVLWIGDPDYLGPVLIRGHQIDGPNELRFGDLDRQEDKLFFNQVTQAETNTSSPSSWRNWPSYTYVRAPGCYAYQVDGIDFSYVIVVQAVDALPPPPVP